jgi:replicative DNA helicase
MSAPIIPPHSDELEQSMLGALLLDNRVWDRVAASVAEADFYVSRHRSIFAEITALLAAGRAADVITVYERLKTTGSADAPSDLAYLNALAQSVPSAANARHYAGRLRELRSQRELIALAGEALETARGATHAGEAADAIAAKFGELALRRVARAPRSIVDIAISRIDHYTALQDGSVAAGWLTRVPALDAWLNGGLRPGSLYILAARPSVGKSSLSEAIGLTLAGDGHPTLFCSMEMADSEVADRAVSNLGRVSYGALLTGRLDDDGWSRVTEATDRLSRLPFHVDDEPALTLRAIRAKARSVKGLQVLIIDYLQLCASTRRDGNRNSEIEEISRGLKALAKELGIAVIALSQLNRDVEKRVHKRPTLSDLRDSGAIEQDADVVMFLWPVREFEGEGRRIIGLGIDKNRQGRLGEIGLDFYGNTQRWEQSTADIRPAPAAHRSGDDL